MITPMKSSTTKKDVSKVRVSSSLFRKSSPDPPMRRWMACGYFPPSQHPTTDPVVHGEEGGREERREKKTRNGYGKLGFGKVAFPKSFQIYTQVMIFWRGSRFPILHSSDPKSFDVLLIFFFFFFLRSISIQF